MKNIKVKRIVYSSVIVAIFALGMFMRPAFDLGSELVGGMFGSKQYVAPLSEYETKVNDLWKSEKHQAVCKANAGATVAIGLARKYLEEGEKQSVLSAYDLPVAEAIEKRANYGKM